MKLLTKAIKNKLIMNWNRSAETDGDSDHKPVLKLFTPWAGATWLITELDPENEDTMFGLCDLGHGFPEIGYVSLSELVSIVGPAGLKIERDLYFTADKSLSAYTDEATSEGRIVA